MLNLFDSSDKAVIALPDNYCFIAIATIVDELPSPQICLPSAMVEQSNRLSTKRRQQYLTGRILLAHLLAARLGIHELPAININHNGRPYFVDNQLPDFNISHSGNHIMVALTAVGHLGLDLELIRAKASLMALAKHSFSSLEYQWLLSLSGSLQVDGFWRLWTLRESVLKLAGKGVWQMKELLIKPQQQYISAEFQPVLYSISAKMGDLFWALSSDLPLSEQRIEWWQLDWQSAVLDQCSMPEFVQFSSHVKRDGARE